MFERKSHAMDAGFAAVRVVRASASNRRSSRCVWESLHVSFAVAAEVRDMAT